MKFIIAKVREPPTIENNIMELTDTPNPSPILYLAKQSTILRNQDLFSSKIQRTTPTKLTSTTTTPPPSQQSQDYISPTSPTSDFFQRLFSLQGNTHVHDQNTRHMIQHQFPLITPVWEKVIVQSDASHTI